MLALITGASAGFGRELTQILIQRGHRVIATARRRERLQALKDEFGDRLLPLAFDIRDLTAMQNALNSLPSDWRDVDLLVNNAGLALGLCAAHEANLSDWLQMIDTNVRGLTALTHHVLPSMVARNHGHIINVSSIAGNYAYFGSNVYGATKAFVTQFSMNLRADLFGTRVRVSNIEPGVIGGTEFSNVRFHGDDAKAATVYADFENMTGTDIAEIIAWIAELPPRVNINRLEVMPTAQTFGGLKVFKE